ncbi:alcohol dehydrogenase [Spiroplasma sp. JKS002669]|uniref:zinc-binding dehydrogenase n=1 Tax=Spiroplasma attinicola TaxID=2904537 RepID=UPI0020BDCEFF|nr:zinc-binding dehydrogenase [Spiroplasma sp. JKS002669]MCL6428610.1 alcohol dehydrogenase [Spiroplasma sp. JKS002669]
MEIAVASSKANEIIELVKVPDLKKIKDDEVLVKTLFCSLCHSDLHVALDFKAEKNYKISVGHETVAQVVEVGKDVTNVKVGDAVAFPAGLHNACGKCKNCLKGEEVFCDNAEFVMSETKSGTMQDYSIEKGSFCTVVPKNIDLAKACVITCAGLTVYKALKVADVQENDYLAIYGIGGLGQVAIEYAKNVFKAKVIAIGSNLESLKIAKDKGADFIINWKSENVDERIKEITNNKGFDQVLFTSSSAQLLENSIKNLAKLGKITVVGLDRADFNVNIADLVLNGKQILGSLVGTRQDLVEALDAFEKGLVNPEINIEPIAKAPEYFKLMNQGKLFKRIVFKYDN